MTIALAHQFDVAGVTTPRDAPAQPATAGGSSLSLPVLIDCLEQRMVVARADERTQVGCLADLLEQAIPYLRQMQRLSEQH